MKRLLILAMAVTGLSAFAIDETALSVFQATGTATVSHDPEFMDVQYSVSASCFKNANDATNSANQKMNDIKSELQKIATAKDDKVLASGTRLSYQPSVRDTQNPKGCDGGYYATGSVAVRLTVEDKASIGTKFSTLQQIGTKANPAKSGVIESQVSVEQGSPRPGLTTAT